MLPWEPVAMASLSYFTSKLSSLVPSLHVTTFLLWSIASASAEKYLFCSMHTALMPVCYDRLSPIAARHSLIPV